MCDVKVFQNLFEAITNVPVGRDSTSVVHNEWIVYITILNEALFFGNSMDHSLIKPNQIRSFGIPVYGKLFNTTWEFGIDYE